MENEEYQKGYKKGYNIGYLAGALIPIAVIFGCWTKVLYQEKCLSKHKSQEAIMRVVEDPNSFQNDRKNIENKLLKKPAPNSICAEN